MEPPDLAHGHLWTASDGTGLHAPLGVLVRDPDSARVCCHLCGRWFTLLGAHVRVHGHTPDTYRELVGLCRTRALAATTLSDRLRKRQRLAYEEQPAVRERLAPGQQLARSGQLTASLADARSSEPLERRRARAAQLAQGRVTRRERQDVRLAQLLAEHGAVNLPVFLRMRYAQGDSLETLARTTGLGRARLRAALTQAGVPVRPSGVNTDFGQRSRARTADARAAERLGVDDLAGWLLERRHEGWSLTRLGEAVGHSTHWVRWRLEARAAAQAISSITGADDGVVRGRLRSSDIAQPGADASAS